MWRTGIKLVQNVGTVTATCWQVPNLWRSLGNSPCANFYLSCSPTMSVMNLQMTELYSKGELPADPHSLCRMSSRSTDQDFVNCEISSSVRYTSILLISLIAFFRRRTSKPSNSNIGAKPEIL